MKMIKTRWETQLMKWESSRERKCLRWLLRRMCGRRIWRLRKTRLLSSETWWESKKTKTESQDSKSKKWKDWFNRLRSRLWWFSAKMKSRREWTRTRSSQLILSGSQSKSLMALIKRKSLNPQRLHLPRVLKRGKRSGTKRKRRRRDKSGKISKTNAKLPRSKKAIVCLPISKWSPRMKFTSKSLGSWKGLQGSWNLRS